jgi:ABC-2 type transport system permease protein
VIFLMLAGFFPFAVSHFYEAGQDDLRPFFLWHPWLYLILVPAVAMRLWAEERRQGTLELLFTSAVTPAQAIAGKMIAAWGFLALALALTFPVPLTAAWLGQPDWGVVAAGSVASFLLAGAYLAVGMFTSALTRNQVVSLILAVGAGAVPDPGGLPAGDGPAVAVGAGMAGERRGRVGFMPHYEALQRGVLDARDFLYFGSATGFLLFLTQLVLANRTGR